MADPVSTAKAGRIETWIAMVLFVALLAFHGWGASVGWRNLNLPGCEFRQAQTAISAFFIQREDNFSLAYPTPVLGKPWSIPMEFPLYQWTVVAVSNTTGIPLTQAGRAVSLVCFYLALPALYLLLARIGLPPARRLVALGMVVCCPLYIYYARAFLIETMALMFGVWFLLGYINAVERRSVAWLLVAAVGGAGAGLVKVTTFLFFLAPAFLWTMGWLWRAAPGRPGGSWRSILAVAGWALGAVAVGCIASVWWVRYSDAIKAQSPAGDFLVSSRMSGYNFGIGVRFAPWLWAQHWAVLFREIVWLPVLAGVGVLFAVFGRRRWLLVATLVFLFMAVQVVFPILYAWHEYYYVANAFTLMLALGLVLAELFASRLPRAAVWLLVGLAYAGQIGVYFRFYYPLVKDWSPGGSHLTVALNTVMDSDDVMVIAGDDWNSMIPYYAQRRAYMIRRDLERDWDVMRPALDRLKGEQVTAFVAFGAQRENRDLIEMMVKRLDLDPRPVFSWHEATVYLRRDLRLWAISMLYGRAIPEIEMEPNTVADKDGLLKRELEVAGVSPRLRRTFKYMTPQPWKYYTSFGADLIRENEGEVYTAHPETRLWFKAPPGGAQTVSIECMMPPTAYDRNLPDYDRTDGVEFRISTLNPDGSWRTRFSYLLDPANNAEDRGLRKFDWDSDIPGGSDIMISTHPGPNNSSARDWLEFGRIVIQ